jgi:PTS system nitrogen regulatory IIA component
MQTREIMTIEEVAKHLRVSERTIYEWAQKGDIPCGKLGSTWRFIRSEVDAWVDKRLKRKNLQVPNVDYERTLDVGRVLILPDVGKKDDCLTALVDSLAEISSVRSREELWEGIVHREKLMSTGIGLGVAIPHARLPGVSELSMAVAVCPQGLSDYEAMDDKLVRLVFMIVAGVDQHAHYIRLLSFISSRVKQDTLRERLVEATDPQVFHDTFLKMP